MPKYMAAGKNAGYRDNDFGDQEFVRDVARREFAYSKGGYDQTRNGDRDNERGRVREGDSRGRGRVPEGDGRGRGRVHRDGDSRERGRVRQKDIKERELMNGGLRSISNRSDSGSSGGGHMRSGFSVGAIDREPGELSSESGSDEAIDSEFQPKDAATMKLENGTQPPLQIRKRKFSPIVWDRDEVSNLSSSRISSAASDLPPPPPLPKSYLQSPNSFTAGGVQICPMEDGKQNSSVPLVEPHVDIVSQVSAVAESPAGFSPSSLEEQRVEYNEDYAPMRNIRSSRWANDADSPADEGEISDIPADSEMQKRMKKMSNATQVEMRVRKKSTSPEFGEPRIEGSEGARARSSESDEGGVRGRSSSRDDYADKDSDKNDYMEVDEERNNGRTSVSHTDTESEDEGDSRDTPEPATPPQRSVNMLQGCRSVDEFERLNKIDEGTYGVVYRARDKKTGEIVALKKVKMEKEREGFPLTSLREINILLSFDHPSIVDVKEVVVGNSLDSIFMVMEYMEHDLKQLMETLKQPFSQSEVKQLMLQLLEGVKYLHDNWVLHRDLKTSNLLYNNRGGLKICDFGLARQYGSPLKPYTHLVVTLWYRAPELLLGAKQYSTAIDMWSLGCIMAELLSKQPLFNGRTEVDQIDKIFRMLGTPNETIWPGFSKLPGVKVNFVKHQYNLLRRKFPATSFTGSPVLSDAGFDLLNKLLTYDPEKRITAEAALNHEWFREVPLPKSRDFMPTFPASHAQDRRTRRVMKSPDPLEEQRRKELQQAELGTGGLFG